MMQIISQIWLVQLIAKVMFNLAALIQQQQAEPQSQTVVSIKQTEGVTCVLKKTKLSKNHSCTRLYANQGTFLSVCNHPNIVKYYRSYFLPDYSFHIEMEYLKGGSLCYANINGDFQKAYKWIYQTASALAYIHKLGIIHRDIKPANLVLDEDDNVKIIDFGVSMFKWCEGIQQKTIIGTPCYFAPETITSSVYNQKTDVFALGITSYQVTYNLFPFKGAVKQEYWRSILHDQVSFPQTCPKDLIRLIQKMLAKKPADRFSTHQILEELQLRQNREMKVQEMIDND